MPANLTFDTSRPTAFIGSLTCRHAAPGSRGTTSTRSSSSGVFQDLGLLSIDVDGNDYWIWEAIDSVRPRIVIVEYNSVLGLQPISIPYQGEF